MSNAARIFRPYSTPADGYICTFRFSPYFSRSFSYFVLYLLVKSSAVMLVKICITFLVAWLRFISLISFSFNFFFLYQIQTDDEASAQSCRTLMQPYPNPQIVMWFVRELVPGMSRHITSWSPFPSSPFFCWLLFSHRKKQSEFSIFSINISWKKNCFQIILLIKRHLTDSDENSSLRHLLARVAT